MFTTGASPPEPWWLEVHKVKAGSQREASLSQIHWRVNLRPLGDVNITTHWVDQQGHIIASQWFSNTSDGRMMTFDTRPIDRSTLLKAFKQLEPEITAWETEWPEDAQTQPSK